jgi:hypothetical protein
VYVPVRTTGEDDCTCELMIDNATVGVPETSCACTTGDGDSAAQQRSTASSIIARGAIAVDFNGVYRRRRGVFENVYNNEEHCTAVEKVDRRRK